MPMQSPITFGGSQPASLGLQHFQRLLLSILRLNYYQAGAAECGEKLFFLYIYIKIYIFKYRAAAHAKWPVVVQTTNMCLLKKLKKIKKNLKF